MTGREMEKGKRKGRRSSLSLSLFYGRKKKKPWQLGGSIQTSLKGSSWHNVVGEEPSCIYIYIYTLVPRREIKWPTLFRSNVERIASARTLIRYSRLYRIWKQFSFTINYFNLNLFSNAMFEKCLESKDSLNIYTSLKVLFSLKAKFKKNLS